MNENKKSYARIFLPLLAYPVLYLPYSILNREVLVEKYGCGCPGIDPVTGETVTRAFNANTITWYFWIFLALLCTVLAAVTARRVLKSRLPAPDAAEDGRTTAWTLGSGWVCTACAVVCALAAIVLSLLIIRRQMWN